MRRFLQSALLLLLAAPLAPAQTLDRIVVVVNRRAILASEWEQALRYESFLEGRALESLTDGDSDKVLDRLIDQELLREEMEESGYEAAAEAEVAAHLAEVRAQLLPGAADVEWQAALARHGLAESDLRERLARHLELTRFIDLRFRAGIHIDPRAVAEYYRETFAPQVRAAGAQPPEERAAAPQIEQLLVQQRIGELLEAHLKNLRAQSHIHRLDPEPQAEAKAR